MCEIKQKRAVLSHSIIAERLIGRNIELLEFSGKAITPSLFRCLVKTCGYEWRASSNSVTRGAGCPNCSGKRKQTHEDVVRKIGDRPIELVTYAGKMLGKSTFRCKVETCGHTWEATADNVTRGKGCPKCAKNNTCNLEELVTKLKPRNITVIDYPGLMSGKAKFRCDVDGTEWEANVTSVVTSGRGCPTCGRLQTRVTAEEAQDKLRSYDIELVAKGDLVEDRASFRCLKDGHEWSTDLKQVLYGQTGCPKCAGVVKVTEAEAVSRLEGREIELIAYAGTTAGKSRFKCNLDGYEWSTTLSSIVTNGQGCPICARSGFKPDQPAFFYIYRLVSGGTEYLGFGITNNLRRRKAEHTGSIRSANATGYLCCQFEMMGRTAQELEASLKRNLPICNTGIEGFIREAVLYSPEMLEYIEGRASACLGT